MLVSSRRQTHRALSAQRSVRCGSKLLNSGQNEVPLWRACNVRDYGSGIYRVDSYVVNSCSLLVLPYVSWRFSRAECFRRKQGSIAAVPAHVVLPCFSGGAAASLGTAVQSLLRSPAPRFLSMVSKAARFGRRPSIFLVAGVRSNSLPYGLLFSVGFWKLRTAGTAAVAYLEALPACTPPSPTTLLGWQRISVFAPISVVFRDRATSFGSPLTVPPRE